MELKYLKKEDFSRWNSFVDNSMGGSIFSKSWYLDALQVDYNILVIEERNLIKAGVILAKNEIKTYSNPMLDKYLGIILAIEEGNRQKIVSKEYKYMDILSTELKKIQSFDYYFHPSFTNWIPFSWKGFTQQTRYTYLIKNKEKSLDEIYNQFHGNIKNDIKNAIKKKVVIKRNIPFEELWSVVNKTFMRQGSQSPFNKNKLKYFIEELQNKKVFISFGIYDLKSNCIAVCGLVYEEKSSYLLLNGVDIENQVRGANSYMLYESIKYFHSVCDSYDFEGSMLVGIEPFYRKFGGELTPYMRIWNDNFFNYAKTKAKKIYKKIRYGR